MELHEQEQKERKMNTYKEITYHDLGNGQVRSTFPGIGEMLFSNYDEFVRYADGYSNTKRFFKLIETEIRNAVERHPKLCDFVVNPKTDWSWLEISQKHTNDVSAPPYYGENILLEEFAEAMNAYQQGRLEDSLHELAQCGAVILRIMETIEKEIKK